MATPSLIAEVIIKKYEHHLPWYRQSQIFAQDGLDIPANTIYSGTVNLDQKK